MKCEQRVREDMSLGKASASVWDRHVAGLCSKIVSAGAILPIQLDGSAPSPSRKSVIFAQKGITLRVPEATALIEAVMDGKIHRDYVVVGGQQCTSDHLLPCLARPVLINAHLTQM